MTTDTRPPLSRTMLFPIRDIDPRFQMDDRALVEASRNAFPIVAKTKARKDGFGLVAGGSIALIFGGLTFWSMSGNRLQPASKPSPTAPLVAPPSQMPVTMASPRPFAPPPGLMMPSTSPIGAPVLKAEPRVAPTVVFDASTSTPIREETGLPQVTVTPQSGGGQLGALGENEQFAGRIGGPASDVASARPLSNPATTIVQGTLIPAVLETSVNTDLPGYVRAVVSQDVRSFDGSRLLVPRSSRLIGQYKSGLAAGQTRAYIIWTRLIRPDGASVALASPAVDFAGSSGLDGKVDSHFLKRFGSSLLLSVVGGLTAAGNAAVVLSGGQSAASVAAQRDAQMPPTVRVLPGEPIRIFTARDLDFAAVATEAVVP